MAEGPQAGLTLLAELRDVAELEGYHPFFATRAELLRRLGRHSEALPDYQRGVELAKNGPERRYLARRSAELEQRGRDAA